MVLKSKNFTPGRTDYTNKQVKRILASLRRIEELEAAKNKLLTIHTNTLKKLQTLRVKTPKKK